MSGCAQSLILGAGTLQMIYASDQMNCSFCNTVINLMFAAYVLTHILLQLLLIQVERNCSNGNKAVETAPSQRAV